MSEARHYRKKTSPAARKRQKLLLAAGAVLAVLLLTVILLLILHPWKREAAPVSSISTTTAEALVTSKTSASSTTSSSVSEVRSASASSSSAAASAAETSAPPASRPESSSAVVTPAPAESETAAAAATVDSIPYDPGDWALKLVNFETPLEDGFSVSLSRIKSDYNPSGLKIDSRIVDAVNIMCDAAARDGVDLTVISAYRTEEKQSSLYNNKVDRLMNQGYNREDALVEAATAVARPGTSEHQVGLAIDFNSVEQDFEHTEAGKWLRAHSVEYGFVMRYPTDKTEITGVIYEPWHFRFVGRKHAAEMQNLDMCLEEYLDYLGK